VPMAVMGGGAGLACSRLERVCSACLSCIYCWILARGEVDSPAEGPGPGVRGGNVRWKVRGVGDKWWGLSGEQEGGGKRTWKSGV
jgi:hypothetical protein